MTRWFDALLHPDEVRHGRIADWLNELQAAGWKVECCQLVELDLDYLILARGRKQVES